MTHTTHGHHIPWTTRLDEIATVDTARCGGVTICTVCQRDAAQATDSAFKPGAPFEDTSDYAYDPDRFLKLAKLYSISARNAYVENVEDLLTVEDMYIVWFTKTLSNWKALVSTSKEGDGLYFEVTHNGEKEETYVDTYLKLTNDTFSQEGGI